jgi:tryptophan 2,3-dioxygenase
MGKPDPTLTYVQYLNLDQVLTAQKTRSAEHDELLFIVIHQIYELWFKQLLHELGAAQRHLQVGDTAHSVRSLDRTAKIFRVAVDQLDVLETMTPLQFAGFRPHLAASSGYESAQFRELEAVLGRRDPAVAERYRAGSAERARIVGAMTRPALFDSFLRYLDKHGYKVPQSALLRDFDRPWESSDEVVDLLYAVYQEDGESVLVCEHLVTLDEIVQEWRYRHVKMVERTIGGKRGTAGSTGSAYLRTTVGKPAFPDLWAVRTQL